MGHEYTFYPVRDGIVVAGTPVASYPDAKSQDGAVRDCLRANPSATGTARAHASEDVAVGAKAGEDLDAEVPRPKAKIVVVVVTPGELPEEALASTTDLPLLKGEGFFEGNLGVEPAAGHMRLAVMLGTVPFSGLGPKSRYQPLQAWTEGESKAFELPPAHPEADVVYGKYLAALASKRGLSVGTLYVVTYSEALVLSLAKEAREGRIKTSDLRFVTAGVTISLSDNGRALNTPWPGGFFLWRDGLM